MYNGGTPTLLEAVPGKAGLYCSFGVERIHPIHCERIQSGTCMGVLALPLGLSRAGLCRVSHILGLVVDSSSGNIAAEHCDPFHAEALSSIFGSLLSTVYFQSCSASISFLHCEYVSQPVLLILESASFSLLSLQFFTEIVFS